MSNKIKPGGEGGVDVPVLSADVYLSWEVVWNEKAWLFSCSLLLLGCERTLLLGCLYKDTPLSVHQPLNPPSLPLSLHPFIHPSIQKNNNTTVSDVVKWRSKDRPRSSQGGFSPTPCLTIIKKQRVGKIQAFDLIIVSATTFWKRHSHDFLEARGVRSVAFERLAVTIWEEWMKERKNKRISIILSI